MLRDLLIRMFKLNQKRLDVKFLPSQGLFYDNDFSIYIKKASKENISYYNNHYDKSDVINIISLIKKIVYENTMFKGNYSYSDIKSIDLIFIFLEIVKFTKSKKILLDYGVDKIIEFDSDNFNYFQVSELLSYYDYDSRNFLIDGYKFKLPSIGVENSVTEFLINKSNLPDTKEYNVYFYDFTYFVGSKNILTVDEIENLIQIFNFDMEDNEICKIKNIIKIFSPLQKYSLLKDNKVVDINSKINLLNIWD
jgi:hypothetical protein